MAIEQTLLRQHIDISQCEFLAGYTFNKWSEIDNWFRDNIHKNSSWGSGGLSIFVDVEAGEKPFTNEELREKILEKSEGGIIPYQISVTNIYGKKC